MADANREKHKISRRVSLGAIYYAAAYPFADAVISLNEVFIVPVFGLVGTLVSIYFVSTNARDAYDGRNGS